MTCPGLRDAPRAPSTSVVGSSSTIHVDPSFQRLLADYRAAAPSTSKRWKDESTWVVELEPTTDVLGALGALRRPGQVIVGFAADEAEAGLERAREKRRAKHADLFVYNDVSRADIGFDSLENEVTVVSANGDRHVAKAPKRVVAAAVLDEVERLLSET